MALLGLGLTHHWTSPYARARQTAEALVTGSGQALPMPEDVDLLADAFSVAGITVALGALPPGTGILLVGHQPDLGELAAAWLGTGPEHLEFKKGALALFEVDPGSGKGLLQWLVPVKLMQSMGGAQ